MEKITENLYNGKKGVGIGATVLQYYKDEILLTIL